MDSGFLSFFFTVYLSHLKVEYISFLIPKNPLPLADSKKACPSMKVDFKSVEHYIETFPKEIQPLLEKVRSVITQNAPEAMESISYGMPAYKLNGKPLVYFAGYKNHIGFYATPTGHAEFAKELSVYKQGKGSVQFPLNEKMPLDLIKRIVSYRVKENQQKHNKKKHTSQ